MSSSKEKFAIEKKSPNGILVRQCFLMARNGRTRRVPGAKEMETMKPEWSGEWSEAEKQEAKAAFEQLLLIVHDGQGQCRDCGRCGPC